MSSVDARGQSRPAVIVDLDGVVYRGREPVAGSAQALALLESNDVMVTFVTNNSTRTLEQSAEKIRDVVGYAARPEQIVTSARAAMTLIPDGAERCLVIGGEGITEAIGTEGLEIVPLGSTADCVVVGLDRAFDYEKLADAASAIRGGATFIATNRDPTFPTADGLMPGAGSIVAALETASGVAPQVAGKPEKPTVDLIRSMGVGPAWVIGDRIDTDIALASKIPEWRSILVLTGVTDASDDTTAANYVVSDLAEAVEMVLEGDYER